MPWLAVDGNGKPWLYEFKPWRSGHFEIDSKEYQRNWVSRLSERLTLVDEDFLEMIGIDPGMTWSDEPVEVKMEVVKNAVE